MATIDEVRDFALSLPRSYEAIVRDRVKFRVGRLVYVAFSRDETEMGFGYPREERDELIAAAPDTFFRPAPGDLRYQWVECWPARLSVAEMQHYVFEAWTMVVPKGLAAEQRLRQR